MQMGGVGGAQQQWKTCPRCRQRNPKEGPNNHIVCGLPPFALLPSSAVLGWRMSLADACVVGAAASLLLFVLRCVAVLVSLAG